MHHRGQWLITVGLGLWLAAWAPGCTTNGERDDTAVDAGPVPARTVDFTERRVLSGGDQDAWLTGAGNLADTNYCAAEIRLPLTAEPAWVFHYTPAEFSRSAVNTMVHYDGLLVAGAHCSQLLGLDVDTGTQVFNRDVYEHADREGVTEDLSSLFLHPQGLLIGLDFQGRAYCWDMLDNVLDRLWLATGGDDANTVIAAGSGVYCGWGNNLHALAVVDGSTTWEYPNLSGDNALVMSAGGRLVTWTAWGEFFCLEAEAGRLLWAISTGTNGREWATKAVIDNVRSRVYLLLPDERVQCRDLHSSDLLWEHSWSDIVPADVRQRQYAEFNAEAVPLWAIDCVLYPGGLVISMLQGHTIALDADGNRQWVYDSTELSLGSLGFTNAVLVIEWYLGQNFQGIHPAWRSFSAVPPDWERYQSASEQRQLDGSFQRFCLLDYRTGAVLAAFEPEYPVNTILPAHGKIVIGESDRFDAPDRRILAYDWLTWEGE